MEKNKYEILRISGETYNLPIFLDTNLDEMGVMVGFDGDIEQIQQFCNFTYVGSGYTITIFNTDNTNKLKTLVDSEFSINWGDETTGSTTMPSLFLTDLPSISHTYPTNSGVTYDIEVTVDSPWKVEKLLRKISVPFDTSYSFPTDFGELTFNIPYSDPIVEQTQTYLEDYRETTGGTDDSIISFIAVGKSRIDEVKKYGDTNAYIGISTGSTDNGVFTGYTIDGLFYMDYSDGYTHITGSTTTFQKEEVYSGMLTRNEHLIGFIDEPSIYSDIFVERGKQGIMEKNLRLGEIDNVGELDIYGSSFFKVRKQ